MFYTGCLSLHNLGLNLQPLDCKSSALTTGLLLICFNNRFFLKLSNSNQTFSYLVIKQLENSQFASGCRGLSVTEEFQRKSARERVQFTVTMMIDSELHCLRTKQTPKSFPKFRCNFHITSFLEYPPGPVQVSSNQAQ